MNVSETFVQAPLLGEAIDHGPAAVFVADEHMKYVAVNICACEMLGYTRAELLGRRVTDVARYAEAREQYGDMVDRGTHTGTVTLTRKDGTTFPFRYRASRTTVAGMLAFVSVGFPA